MRRRWPAWTKAATVKHRREPMGPCGAERGQRAGSGNLLDGVLRLDENLHGRARADEVPVSVGVVDAGGGRPELLRLEPRNRVGPLCARVGPVPLLGHAYGHGVRRVLKHVVLLRLHARLDLGDLGPDGDERVDEPVELRLVLRLGRLDHDGARHRPRHGGRVEVVVGQPLGHVGLGDPGRRLEAPQVQNKLVRAHARLACEENLVVSRQACRHVVCVEDGHLRGLLEAGRTHHSAVHPRDWQDGCRAPRRAGHGAKGLGAARLDDGVVGQEGLQVGTAADGADAGAAAAVRDAKGLVQVQVAHVGPEVARPTKPHLRVHVCAVHVDLPAVLVDGVTDLDDGLLEDAVRRRVGDHEGRQMVLVLDRLGRQVGNVHVSVGVAPHRHDAHAAHGRRGRVGAVRGDRDQADVAVRLADGGLVGPDGTEAGVLAGGARVWLQRHAREPGDLAQHLLQGVDHRLVPERLRGRRKRVDAVDLGPGDRDHL
mmetsp:Transcript_19985/g.64911  ORF Transcript_19985/g.64911 Transcript_19985/m.64911 type:complete len:484 (-) Transcript_19985:1651-3102(-)